jgi:hypothetical protein
LRGREDAVVGPRSDRIVNAYGRHELAQVSAATSAPSTPLAADAVGLYKL